MPIVPIVLAEVRLGAAGPDLARYFVVVGALLVLILLVGLGLRRLVAGSLRTRATRRSLAVIDVLPLGGRRQLTVVRCYDRTFALGLGEREVSLVAELDPAHASDGEEGSRSPLGTTGPTGGPAGGAQPQFERLLETARRRLTLERAAQAEPATREPVTRDGELVG